MCRRPRIVENAVQSGQAAGGSRDRTFQTAAFPARRRSVSHDAVDGSEGVQSQQFRQRSAFTKDKCTGISSSSYAEGTLSKVCRLSYQPVVTFSLTLLRRHNSLRSRSAFRSHRARRCVHAGHVTPPWAHYIRLSQAVESLGVYRSSTP